MNKNVECHLYDLMSSTPLSFTIYKEPIYTKLNGIYGYISVSMFIVNFFWVDGENVCYDDITDRFKIVYVNI